jgi:hypothetical protein
MNKVLLILFLVCVFCVKVTAQTVDSTQSIIFAPDIDGVIKTKVEFDTQHGKMRFEVRNARFGAKGNINKHFGYRAEIDLSDEGKIKMLDAFVKIMPTNNLDIYLGQRKVPFGTDYLRSPADNIFANRSFVAKYVNDGLRDIGLVLNYRIKCAVPIDLWASAMNGTGNNNPQWIDRPNYSGRVTLSPLKNIRIATNFYQGTTLLEKQLSMIGGELRYQNKNFLIETEYMQRHFTDTSSVERAQEGFYIHTYYNFNLKNKMIKIISPVLRWDIMGENIFSNEKTADRLTGGVNFSFDAKQFMAEIRINYEKYFAGLYSYHVDNFVVEFVAKF